MSARSLPGSALVTHGGGSLAHPQPGLTGGVLPPSLTTSMERGQKALGALATSVSVPRARGRMLLEGKSTQELMLIMQRKAELCAQLEAELEELSQPSDLAPRVSAIWDAMEVFEQGNEDETDAREKAAVLRALVYDLRHHHHHQVAMVGQGMQILAPHHAAEASGFAGMAGAGRRQLAIGTLPEPMSRRPMPAEPEPSRRGMVGYQFVPDPWQEGGCGDVYVDVARADRIGRFLELQKWEAGKQVHPPVDQEWLRYHHLAHGGHSHGHRHRSGLHA